MPVTFFIYEELTESEVYFPVLRKSPWKPGLKKRTTGFI